MKVNDLRIGNWIMFRNWETGLFDNDLPIVEVQELLWIESGNFEAEPIQVTEEWLIKFGLKKGFNGLKSCSGDNGFKREVVVEIEFSGCNDVNLWISEEDSDDCMTCKIGKEIKYVHQLQNFYFALTGEELTIKE